ncbi:hypothetical protein KNP414_00796 [Paenibacillus mucilaginosus KNP414]|uniref:Uncharacterized protein n=1 Tax=Paenibacillus mucilaginosus (strain KNP414) TaxID=1036673 RepID=F8FRD6_PAEMK|nr:hypothetical protein KNP414_00796 [Paenibacillus mucilaginosus KNP414]
MVITQSYTSGGRPVHPLMFLNSGPCDKNRLSRRGSCTASRRCPEGA